MAQEVRFNEYAIGLRFVGDGRTAPRIIAVAQGSEAHELGLQSGMRIMRVDGVDVSRTGHAACAEVIRTAPRPVTLSVLPRGVQEGLILPGRPVHEHYDSL